MPKQTTNLNSQNSVHFSSRENFLSKEFLANILLPCGCGIGMKCLTLDSQQCFHDSVEVEVGWRAAAAHGTVAWQKQERQHLVRFSASWWAISMSVRRRRRRRRRLSCGRPSSTFGRASCTHTRAAKGSVL